jgi:5S rRNA maturation endonuclease (ribonuclease M5)
MPPSSASQTPKTFQSFKVNESPNLHESLKERIVELSQTLLGDPSSRSAYQYRFGRKGSISVMVSGSNQGLYSNFESGVHGGAIKMIEEKLQLSSKEAIGWAKDWLGQTLTPTPIRSISPQQSLIKDQEKGTTWTPILPVPSHAPKPDIKTNPYLSYMTKEREFTSVYTYKDQQGQTLGYVARLEDKDGSKITPTLTYCENEKGQQHWRWKGFGDNRPLYGLDRLAENKPVLIVEGEKAADAAQKLLPNHAVLSWAGGVGAINKADWSPLVGRDVTIWPDNDVPGQKAATQITQELAKLNQSAAKEPQIKIVDLPKDLPAKWDLADKMPETLTVDKVRELIKPGQKLMTDLAKGDHRVINDGSVGSRDDQPRVGKFSDWVNEQQISRYGRPIDMESSSHIKAPRESEFTKRLNEMHIQQYGRPLDMESTAPVKAPRESEFTRRLNEQHLAQYGRPLDMTPSPVKNASTQPSGSNFQKSQSDLLADSFIKRYKEFVTADKDDRTTPSQKEEFKQEIKATFKDEKLMAAIKANNTEIGKEVETLAKSYERQLQQQRGFDMSR